MERMLALVGVAGLTLVIRKNCRSFVTFRSVVRFAFQNFRREPHSEFSSKVSKLYFSVEFSPNLCISTHRSFPSQKIWHIPLLTTVT